FQAEDGIRDFHVTGVQTCALPISTAYKLSYEEAYMITIRLNRSMSTSESLAAIEKVFQKVLPSAVFDYKFVDQEYARKFASEERSEERRVGKEWRSGWELGD